MLTTLPRLPPCRPYAGLLHSSFPLCQLRDLSDFMRDLAWATSASVYKTPQRKTAVSGSAFLPNLSKLRPACTTGNCFQVSALLWSFRNARSAFFRIGTLYAACHQANSWRYYPTGDLQLPASPWGELWPHHQRKFWHASCPSHQIAVETLRDSSLHTTKINPRLADAWGWGWGCGWARNTNSAKPVPFASFRKHSLNPPRRHEDKVKIY